MTKTKFILFCLAIALPALAGAQVHEDMDFDFRARLSAELDKRIVRGLHLNLSEEFRLKDDFSSVDRFYTTVGLTWKTCPYFKIGAGYTLMNLHRRDDAGGWKWDLRHRATLDLTGMYSAGQFKFSLRERFQLTHRTGDMNIYQNPRNAFALRSRLKAAWAPQNRPVEPYMSVELRNTLNNVHFNSPSYTAEPGDNISYNDVYINRVRIQPGVEWRLTRRQTLDFFLLADYTYEKDIDAKKDGNLKVHEDASGYPVYDKNGDPVYAIYYQKAWHFSLGVSYRYAF